MKFKFVIRIICGIIFSYVLISCQQRPKEVLNRKKMEKVLYDVYIAEAMIENDFRSFPEPEQKEALIQQVFQKHQITQAQWDSSLVWYAEHTSDYLRINDSVKMQLKRAQADIDKLISMQNAQESDLYKRNTALSYIPKEYSFAITDSHKGFAFRLDTFLIAQKTEKPTFDFTFKVHGLPAQDKPDLSATLIIEYKDTTVYKKTPVLVNESYTFTIDRYIPKDTLVSLSGFMSLNDPLNRNRNIVIYDIRMGNKNRNEVKKRQK